MSEESSRPVDGTRAAAVRDRCADAVCRYGQVQTAADLRRLYKWARTCDWFLRSRADEDAMRQADEMAQRRIAVNEEADLALAAMGVARRLRGEVLRVLVVLREHRPQIADEIRMGFLGNQPKEALSPEMLAKWISPAYQGNRVSQITLAALRAGWGFSGDASRSAFTALRRSEQAAINALVDEVVESHRDEFRESFPGLCEAEERRVR